VGQDSDHSRRAPRPFWVRFRAHYYLKRRIQRLGRLRALAAAFDAAQSRNYGRSAPMPSEVLVRIDADGAAWEMTDEEKAYVDKPFSPSDGARPYIKADYDQRDPLGRIEGFIDRAKLPSDVRVRMTDGG
jgi:hypothetical protein